MINQIIVFYKKHRETIDLILFGLFCIGSYLLIYWVFFIYGYPNSTIWQRQ